MRYARTMDEERNPLSEKLQRKLIALSLHRVYDEEPAGVWKVMALMAAIFALGLVIGKYM